MSDGLPTNQITCGDSLEVMKTWPDKSIQCCVTSPPYWGLRDYGTASWEGGDAECDHTVGGQVQDNKAPGAIVSGQRPGVDASTCKKCGARRIDQQLGLEKTPEEYVAKMVEVFREVKRVLRDDGTLWLNLGDSYWGGKGASGSSKARATAEERGYTQSGGTVQMNKRPSDGTHPTIKPKDLCGIPWRVALALQQPYYTGTIKDERDRIWLASMIDAEGCIFIHKRKAGRDNGQGYTAKKDSYGSGIEVSNTCRAIPERCLAITGKGSICMQEGGRFGRKQTLYRWNLRSNECRDVLREVYPHFVAKQHEARLAMGCPVDGKDAINAHTSLKAIHQGEEPTIDFKPPATMFEQGWFLRQDIIWSKCNPMPESCTDRCTKAHEYLFLLTKKPRYFYDAEAIREGNQVVTRKAGGYKNHSEQMIDGYSPFKGKGGFADSDITTVGRNKRSVWTIPTKSFPDAHFATFPPKLIEPCILAGTSQRGACPECGGPWERVVEKSHVPDGKKRSGVHYESNRGESYQLDKQLTLHTTVGWRPTCNCTGIFPGAKKPCVVFDPFMGSGTVAMVAAQHGRDYIGTELNPEYAQMARERATQGETGITVQETRKGQKSLFEVGL